MSEQEVREQLLSIVTSHLKGSENQSIESEISERGMTDEEYWQSLQPRFAVMPESMRRALELEKNRILDLRKNPLEVADFDAQVKSMTDRLLPVLLEHRRQKGIDGSVDEDQFMAVVSISAAKDKLRAKEECIRELESVPDGLRKDMLRDCLKLFDDNDS